MIHVVVSRYHKNVSWIYKLANICDVNIIIYDKENPDNIFNIPVNRGHEASTYLRYIIDYYDTLPSFTFFVQDDEYAWHHSGTIEQQFCNALNSGQEYFNINDRCPLDDFHKSVWKDPYLKWYAQYIEPYIPLSSLPDDWMTGQRGCAQFLVHRNRIRRYSKEFYQMLYDWVISPPIDGTERGSINAIFMEWTWHILWSDIRGSREL